jgi:plasmid stabilization system protein ParE
MAVRANRDLATIFERIEAADSLAAAKWFNGLEEAILSLAELPRRCPVAPESRKTKRSLRHLLYGSKPDVYRVLYEIDEKAKSVWVLAVRHGARDSFDPTGENTD